MEQFAELVRAEASIGQCKIYLRTNGMSYEEVTTDAELDVSCDPPALRTVRTLSVYDYFTGELLVFMYLLKKLNRTHRADLSVLFSFLRLLVMKKLLNMQRT